MMEVDGSIPFCDSRRCSRSIFRSSVSVSSKAAEEEDDDDDGGDEEEK